jgi:hypothetical protein
MIPILVSTAAGIRAAGYDVPAYGFQAITSQQIWVVKICTAHVDTERLPIAPQSFQITKNAKSG